MVICLIFFNEKSFEQNEISTLFNNVKLSHQTVFTRIKLIKWIEFAGNIATDSVDD